MFIPWRALFKRIVLAAKQSKCCRVDGSVNVEQPREPSYKRQGTASHMAPALPLEQTLFPPHASAGEKYGQKNTKPWPTTARTKTQRPTTTAGTTHTVKMPPLLNKRVLTRVMTSIGHRVQHKVRASEQKKHAIHPFRDRNLGGHMSVCLRAHGHKNKILATWNKIRRTRQALLLLQ